MNSSIGTTNIDALPGNNINNLSEPQYKQLAQQPPPQFNQPPPQFNSQPPQQQQQQPPQQQQQYQSNMAPLTTNDSTFNQTHMNQVVTGIQQASQSGMTQLPIRDVPRNQSHLVQDQQITPNYVPPPSPESKNDYISEQGQPSQIIYNNETAKKNIYEQTFKELNTPIIIGILYFIFQLPSFRKYLLKIMPDLFNTDGHPNLWGYIVNSGLFSSVYYILTKLMDKLDHINI